uniref:Uncharacterized protein n=1 Tax=Daphnia galeata TaxID=27404 RepID=A0A8J2R9K2_9CRUS|nr:unnamed protein product [Daphnia galeata]
MTIKLIRNSGELNCLRNWAFFKGERRRKAILNFVFVQFPPVSSGPRGAQCVSGGASIVSVRTLAPFQYTRRDQCVLCAKVVVIISPLVLILQQAIYIQLTKFNLLDSSRTVNMLDVRFVRDVVSRVKVLVSRCCQVEAGNCPKNVEMAASTQSQSDNPAGTRKDFSPLFYHTGYVFSSHERHDEKENGICDEERNERHGFGVQQTVQLYQCRDGTIARLSDRWR